MTDMEYILQEVRKDLDKIDGRIFAIEVVVSVLTREIPESRRAHLDTVLRRMSEIRREEDWEFVKGMQESARAISMRKKSTPPSVQAASRP